MSRYPYTEACDAIRMAAVGAGFTVDGGELCLSRSQASSIRSMIAYAIGMPDEDLARRIADYARRSEQGL